MKKKESFVHDHSCTRAVEIYRLCKVEGLDNSALMKKFGISRTTV